MILFPPTAAMVLVCGAVCTDLLWQRIPNWLTLPFICLGFWLNGMILGPGPGSLFALKGLGAGLGFLIIPFALGGAGGGDVKLLGAMGALTGTHAVLWTFLYGAMAGGLVSLFLIIRKKEIRSLKGVAADAKTLALGASPGPADRKNRTVIPYSLPIFAGYLGYTLGGGLA